MNDKNFIEELRQKREEYGVTQTRLAVACGISREYYNRIEKGKQPLNDELREIIEKQIERFNPQEPLFLLIDYFRVRFPTTDALAIIRDVLQLKSNYMLYEDNKDICGLIQMPFSRHWIIAHRSLFAYKEQDTFIGKNFSL